MEDQSQDEASSSSSSDTKPKKSQMGRAGISLVNDDLLHNILSRLPALTFASAACVSKSWNLICTRILSRPRIASALSVKLSPRDAINEVLDKVLSNPIRPHFAIANVGSGLGARETLIHIEQKLGPRVPIIVSCVGGIIGRDALTDQFREIKWDDMDSDPEEEYEQVPSDVNIGIVLTVGFLPGLKVDAIPLLRPTKAPQVAMLDKFVMDIRDYTSSVSGCRSPVGIVMFGDEHIDQKPIMEKLDYAMPMETVILGDERACFVYRSADESRNVCGSIKYFSDAVALVFAKDRNKPPGVGEIQFHAAISTGVSAIGSTYKAISVRGNTADRCTWLTARREGHQEILDGQTILNNINDAMENRIGSPDLYVGVTKQRKCAVGSEKARRSKYLSFHGVSGGDNEYLYVDGLGIKTGDYFQFYHSNPNVASSSCGKVTESLQNLKLNWNSKNCHHMNGDNNAGKEAFGGFIFTCSGRGESFFGCLNTDSSPILHNFPGIPLAGIFCGGEICRGSPNLIAQESQGEGDSHCFLHVYSTVYLILSLTPGLSDH